MHCIAFPIITKTPLIGLFLFDRIILAQALSEGMALLARDDAFGDYDVRLL